MLVTHNKYHNSLALKKIRKKIRRFGYSNTSKSNTHFGVPRTQNPFYVMIRIGAADDTILYSRCLIFLFKFRISLK